MRDKLIYRTNYCKGCIWLKNDTHCPFLRCVKAFGFVADKKAQKGDKNAK